MGKFLTGDWSDLREMKDAPISDGCVLCPECCGVGIQLYMANYGNGPVEVFKDCSECGGAGEIKALEPLKRVLPKRVLDW